jgi:hypothetical protein
MPQYRVLQQLFINNKLAQEGDVIEFDGEFDPAHLECLDDKPKSKGKGKGAAASEDSQEQAGE